MQAVRSGRSLAYLTDYSTLQYYQYTHNCMLQVMQPFHLQLAAQLLALVICHVSNVECYCFMHASSYFGRLHASDFPSVAGPS